MIVIAVVTFISAMADGGMRYRGIVYDVGLQFTPGNYSVDSLSPEAMRYDMDIIANVLRCNAVRIEGEDPVRLVEATRIAHDAGLEVFFNPWLMGEGVDTVATYMANAARLAQSLRNEGIDLTFVAGCEFSAFNKGIFEGNTINERLASMPNLVDSAFFVDSQARLNSALKQIADSVRANYDGRVTYASGTWEMVDWSLFDIVGIDYYRDRQTDDEYVEGLQRYFAIGKPVWVMEVGCCAFEGAAKLGGGGFTICLGVDGDGNGVYAGGQAPRRDEQEQADYIETQVRLLYPTGIEGMFIYQFAFPVSPHREHGYDADLTAYPIVMSFPADDVRSRLLPAWEPKQAFYRLGAVYRELETK